MSNIAISELAARQGWTEASWQMQFLRAVDASPRAKRLGGKADGRVSVTELERYLANPQDLKFVSSTVLDEMTRALDKPGAEQGVSIAKGYKKRWQRTLATRADLATGAPDGKITRAELEAFIVTLRGFADGQIADPSAAKPSAANAPTPTDQRAAQRDQAAAPAEPTTPTLEQTAPTAEQAAPAPVQTANVALQANPTTDQVTPSTVANIAQRPPVLLPGLPRETLPRTNTIARLPDQRAAVLRSVVAEHTGAPDPLSPEGQAACTKLVREYMRLCHDDVRRHASWGVQVLSAPDIRLKKLIEVPRKDAFRADPLLPRETAARPADYLRTGYDMGHINPADASVDKLSMELSFWLSNMAPQAGALNQQSWRRLEAAVQDAVEATGGRAIVYTGTFYLDANGAIDRGPYQRLVDTKTGKTKPVGVPTHFFKAIAFEQPKGVTLMAFILPNREDVPTRGPELEKFVQEGRRPVELINELLGAELFAHLPPSLRKKLASDPAAVVELANGATFEAMTLLKPRAPELDAPALDTAQKLQPADPADAARQSEPTEPAPDVRQHGPAVPPVSID